MSRSCPAQRGDRRRRLRLAARQALEPDRLLGGQQRRAAAPRRSTLLQRSNVHSFQRPDADHVEFDPLADTLSGHAGQASLRQDRRRAHAVQRQRRLPVARVRCQRPRLPAARRRDLAERWFQVRWQTPGKYPCTHASISISGRRSTSTATLQLGGNVNAHWTFQNHWDRRRLQRQRPGTSTIA